MNEIDERQEVLLGAFIETDGNLDEARKTANVPKQVFYRWLREDETFRKRYDEYRLALAAEIENEAVRRVMKPEGQRGSDALATTLLKGLMKDRYAQDQGGPQVAQVVYISGLREKPRPGVQSVDTSTDVPTDRTPPADEVAV